MKIEMMVIRVLRINRERNDNDNNKTTIISNDRTMVIRKIMMIIPTSLIELC